MTKFRTCFQRVEHGNVNYRSEAKLVQDRAADAEPSVIRIGPIVFFSTETGDAWMLDVDDSTASCLAHAGVSEPISIEENANKFLVAWQVQFRIEDNLFTVIEPDGRAVQFSGYPVAEIRRLVDEYPKETAPSFFKTSAIAARLKETGRNDECPCHSGKKYKKCCMTRDEAMLREANSNSHSGASRRIESLREAEPKSGKSKPDDSLIELEDATEQMAGAEPGTEFEPDETEPEKEDDERSMSDPEREALLAPEEEEAADKLWEAFEQLEAPTTEQMNAYLDAVLALPPEATGWNDLFQDFASKKHSDLAGVFRRIVAGVPPSTELNYFYWGAIEEFIKQGRRELVPEAVAGFRMLDREIYNAEALSHVEQWLLAAGFDAELLALMEHFLPIMQGDELMPHSVPATASAIFDLRVGKRLRDFGAPGLSVDALAGEFTRDLEDDLEPVFARRAAEVICEGKVPEAWRVESFQMTDRHLRGAKAQAAALRQFETFLYVSLDVWLKDRRPPGCVLRGLGMIAGVVADERDEAKTKLSRGKINLLDFLHPSGMEFRIATAVRGILGTNTPHALVLLNGHLDLQRFASRHGLIDEKAAANCAATVKVLQQKLGFENM